MDDMVAEKNDEFVWTYLSYVTFKDVVAKSRGYIGACVTLSVFSLIIGGVFDFGAEAISNESSFFQSIPKWTWISVLFSWLAWAYRGEECKVTFPNFGFKSWLFFSILLTVIFAAFEKFEWWVSIPLYFSVILLVQVLDNLALKGKENYQAITDAEKNNF